MTPLFAMEFLSAPQIMLLLVLGVLLFGRKLPDIGRYLGKSITEFKKGMKGLEDEFVDSPTSARPDAPALEQPRPPQRIMTSAPKFSEAPSDNITTPPKV
jgi:sec-independent protein translocase protein TatA